MEVICDNCFTDKLEGFLNNVEDSMKNNSSYQHLIKGDALRIKNYFWESIDEYLIAIKYDKSNIEAFIGLGFAYKQIGCIKNAVKAFNNAKKLNPFDKNLYFEAGCCYCIDQNFYKAVNEYKKAKKLCPDFTEANFNMALAYELLKQYNLAINEYKTVIDKTPEQIQAYNNLGSLYMKLNIYTQAIKTFRNLLKINPEYSKAYLGIAISFDKLNNKSKALRYYKKHLKLKPNSTNVPYILERIYELKEKTRKQKISRENSHLMLVS